MNGQSDQTNESRLFLSLSEQLERLFVMVARLSERTYDLPEQEQNARWQTIHDVSDAAAMLTSAYTQNARLRQRLILPEIEPVAVSSLFYDVAVQLKPFADQYGVELQLGNLPNLSPVMSDRLVLQSALVSLGQVLVMAQSEADSKAPVVFSAHSSRYGIVAGLYLENADLAPDVFRRGHALFGRTSQPLGKFVSGPATGVFLADMLLQAVMTKLHVARYHNCTGLATTLSPCHQLQLV